jgi:hypothetical protein
MDFRSEEDPITGAQRISWDDEEGTTFTLGWDGKTASHTVFKQPKGPLIGDRPPPQEIGNLGNNPNLAEQIGTMFTRDMTGVPKMAVPAQSQVGLHMGESAEQYGHRMTVENEAAKRLSAADRQAAHYSEQKIQALPAQNQAEARKIGAMLAQPAPRQPITDDMRTISSKLSEPIEQPAQPAPSGSPRPVAQPSAAPGTAIDATPRPSFDLAKFMSQTPITPTTSPTPSSGPKMATPKVTDPRRPAPPTGPLRL